MRMLACSREGVAYYATERKWLITKSGNPPDWPIRERVGHVQV